MIEDYDEKRLFHCVSEEMPKHGSIGYFFDKLSVTPLKGTLKGIRKTSQYVFESDSGESWTFFYLLEAPGLYRKFETVEEVEEVFGSVIKKTVDTGEMFGITIKKSTISIVINGAALNDHNVLFISAGSQLIRAEKLYNEWTMDGHRAGAKV